MQEPFISQPDTPVHFVDFIKQPGSQLSLVKKIYNSRDVTVLSLLPVIQGQGHTYLHSFKWWALWAKSCSFSAAARQSRGMWPMHCPSSFVLRPLIYRVVAERKWMRENCVMKFVKVQMFRRVLTCGSIFLVHIWTSKIESLLENQVFVCPLKKIIVLFDFVVFFFSWGSGDFFYFGCCYGIKGYKLFLFGFGLLIRNCHIKDWSKRQGIWKVWKASTYRISVSEQQILWYLTFSFQFHNWAHSYLVCWSLGSSKYALRYAGVQGLLIYCLLPLKAQRKTLIKVPITSSCSWVLRRGRCPFYV